MNPNHHNLLARLPDHLRTPAVRSSLESALGIASRLTARRAEMAASSQYTQKGIDAAVRDLIPSQLRALQVAKSPLAKLKRDVASKREALRPADPDKSDLAGAIERGEIRNHFRSLNPGERHALLLTTTDLRLIEAAVTAPPELSGFTTSDSELVERIEARYIALRHPAEVAELEALDKLVAEAEAIIGVARSEIRTASAMEQRQFEREAAKIEAAVWIVGDPGREQVCEPGPDGTATYRPATPDEIAVGTRFASAAEYLLNASSRNG
jgi:hypothetical protein